MPNLGRFSLLLVILALHIVNLSLSYTIWNIWIYVYHTSYWISYFRNHKAAGEDKIVEEMLKAADNTQLHLFNYSTIYVKRNLGLNNGKIKLTWKKLFLPPPPFFSLFYPAPQKGDITRRNLLSGPTKLFCIVVMERFFKKQWLKRTSWY